MIVGRDCASHHVVLNHLVEFEAAIQKGENSGTKDFLFNKSFRLLDQFLRQESCSVKFYRIRLVRGARSRFQLQSS